jgi:agmatine/peptidylarginine deiminase
VTRFRNRTAVPCLVAHLCFLAVASSRAQTAPIPAQHVPTDVVMLSLEALNPRVEVQQHVRQGLVGESDAELNTEKRLLDIQMNIVRETSKFGPVLLLAPDETTKTAVDQRCREFQICDLLRSDRVRIKVVVHDGVWIRDFGPQIEARGDSANVVHWRYFDIRKEGAKREKFQELETARLKLLETRQQEDQPDALMQGSTPDARKAVVSTIDDKLYVLREYTQILSEASPQRTNDENSAFDVADAVLAAPDFEYKSSAVAIDGGNLFKLEDGRCLTTRVLLSRNKNQNINLDQELEKVGGCRKVTFLDPLPGPVIEHIDMFALPIGGKRILLACYDLSEPFAAEYWSKLSDSERDLALNAELAMERDADRLRRLGYDVTLVPSPFPRVPANGHVYYPSVLNVLIRTATDGYKQVLVPWYRDYETDIQSSALKQIQDSLGPKAEITTIETTEAAKGQGGVHCLTLTAPLPLSIFGDSGDAARRTELLVRKEQLDRNAAEEVASQIPATGLQGSWAILQEEEQSEGTPVELYPQRIFFGENEFQKGVLDRLESGGKYTVDKRDPASWSLHFQFADQEATPAVAHWITKDEVKLTLEDGNSTMVLRRISSGALSPFKSDGQGARQTGDGAGTQSKKRPRQNKPTASTGQASGGLQAVQP